LKRFKTQKNKLACNPDSGRAVVLGAPRSADDDDDVNDDDDDADDDAGAGDGD
jgi:hypothetical protein